MLNKIEYIFNMFQNFIFKFNKEITFYLKNAASKLSQKDRARGLTIRQFCTPKRGKFH